MKVESLLLKVNCELILEKGSYKSEECRIFPKCLGKHRLRRVINQHSISPKPINLNPISTKIIKLNPINQHSISPKPIKLKPINLNPISTKIINANPINHKINKDNGVPADRLKVEPQRISRVLR